MKILGGEFVLGEAIKNDIVKDHILVTRQHKEIAHPQFLKSEGLFGMSRLNSKGLDLTDPTTLNSLNSFSDGVYAEAFNVQSITAVAAIHSVQKTPVLNPFNTSDILSGVTTADPKLLDPVFAVAKAAQPNWNNKCGVARAKILNAASDLIEDRTMRFMAILMREAGKIHVDALAEVREVVDFLRSYTVQAAAEFEAGVVLPGPTGESNTLHLCGWLNDMYEAASRGLLSDANSHLSPNCFRAIRWP